MEKLTIIIADDLTGACDTALQYFNAGRRAKIVIDYLQDFSENDDTDVWAYTTESRNLEKEEALDRVAKASSKLKEIPVSANVYKKIDSTLRGNIGVEIISILETLQKDAAIVAPAYIEEERITIGGYQLLKGIPIERTQAALDPKAPIYESYIPDIIKKDLNEKFAELIGTIDFKTITKGAGPINLKISELIQKGKRIIVADAVSNTDLEQIALAIKKSNYNILPCASAGLAQAFNKIATPTPRDIKVDIPKLPRLIISGSATQLSFNQIKKLEETDKNIYIIKLKIQDIFDDNISEIVNTISQKLSDGIDVAISTSDIHSEILGEDKEDVLIDAGVAKNELSNKITDYLAKITGEINYKNNFILIAVGGETSYKCTKEIDSKYLNIIDAILPAVPLCKDSNDKIIVTKSGNFGTTNTLVDIINYFDKL